jgi:hypothetical protein
VDALEVVGVTKTYLPPTRWLRPLVRTAVDQPVEALRGLASTLAVLGVMVSWYAFHWDIAVHLDVGRDRFLSVPHLLIIAGYGLSGGAGLAGLMMTRLPLCRAWRERPGLVLVAASMGIGLVNLLFDNWWHGTFGRDGTVWSPPHLLLTFVAVVAIIGALLDRRRSGLTGAWVVGASAVLLASLSVLLSEYEYGYPQFRTTWLAPVLAVSGGFVLALARSASRLRWTATWVAVSMLGLRLVAMGANATLGRSMPLPPVALLVAAVAADLLLVGSQRWTVRSTVKTAAAWVPAYVAFELWYASVGLVDLPSAIRVPALAISTVTWLGGVALGHFVGARLAPESSSTDHTGGAPADHRAPRAGVALVAVIIALVFAASALPQLDDVGEQVAAQVDFDGERIIVTVPNATPGDVVTVIGAKEPGCRPQECVKAGGRRWLGRLEQRRPGRFEGVPGEGGDWVAVWYVGGDHVWADVVDRQQSGPVRLEPVAGDETPASPSTLAVAGGMVFTLIVVALWMLAGGLEPRPFPIAGPKSRLASLSPDEW